MPTVWASVPMQPPTTTSRRRSAGLDRGVDLLGRQQRVVALDHLDLAGVDEVVDPAVDHEEREVRAHRLAVHDQRRVHAHLVGQLAAAPSATLECGIGSVKDSCTMPSPVVSPYGRMIVAGHFVASFASRISVAGL